MRALTTNTSTGLWSCIIVLSLLTACNRPSDRPDTAPRDEIYNRVIAPHIQDSLLDIVQPGTFRVEIDGDPYNERVDAATAQIVLFGEAAATVDKEDDGRHTTVHLLLHTEKQGRIELTWETDSEQSTPTLDDIASTYPHKVKQSVDRSRPTVHAEWHEGHRRFTSKSGSLTVLSRHADFVKGTFFFEVQPEGVSDEWFELYGAFDAKIEHI